MNSKRKGTRGENELARWLTAHGFPAKRNEQCYTGGRGNPDVTADGLESDRFEVKRVERLNRHAYYATAVKGGTRTTEHALKAVFRTAFDFMETRLRALSASGDTTEFWNETLELARDVAEKGGNDKYLCSMLVVQVEQLERACAPTSLHRSTRTARCASETAGSKTTAPEGLSFGRFSEIDLEIGKGRRCGNGRKSMRSPDDLNAVLRQPVRDRLHIGAGRTVLLLRAYADVRRFHAGFDQSFQLLHHSRVRQRIHTAMAAAHKGAQLKFRSGVGFEMRGAMVERLQTAAAGAHVV